MSLEFFNAGYRKARIIHKCDCCGQEIKKGEEYYYCSQKYDGEFITYKHHKDCQKVIDDYCEKHDNEFDYFDVAQWWRDEKCDFCKHDHKCSGMNKGCWCTKFKLCDLVKEEQCEKS